MSKSHMSKCVTSPGEDDDVKRERTRVGCDMRDVAEKEAVVVRNLRKEYGSKVAVQNLTIG